MRAWLLLAAALSVVAPAAQAATLKIAEVTGKAGTCHALGGDAPAGEKAYFKHLEARLGRDILTCPVADRAAAGQAVASGAVDMAVLDPAAYGPVAAKTRAILTVRPTGGLNRIPILVVVMAKSPATSLAALKGKSAVFGGQIQATLAAPRQALADQGAGPGYFSREDVAATADAAAAQLRSGADDALVLNAASWSRLCRGDRPQDKNCADLKVVWSGRQRAIQAIVVSRTIPDELRFRLIGIHVAMHIEAKDAFAGAASWMPKAAEFEPTEAEALAVAAN
jgi:ABC-type phosphate/phosphonate transport system substrate-binding protein